jgi:hypothetical protein
MVKVSRYGHVKKKGANGKYQTFTAARAVGLAVEKAHVAAKNKGLGEVSSSDVDRVHVLGDLQIFQQGAFVQCSRGAGCSLRLQPADQQVAVAVMLKQRGFLADCGINVEPCVYSPALRKTLDLVGDFSTTRNFGISGKVWIELKAFSAATFDKSLAGEEGEEGKVKAQFQTLRASDPRFHSAMLLAARLTQEGAAWGTPAVVAKLLIDGEWKDITAGADRRPRAGRVSASRKPNLAKVFQKMSWDHVDGRGGGAKYGMVSDFMKEMGLKLGNPGKRAGTWNKIFANANQAMRFSRQKILDKPGSEPWMGTKDAFRFIWENL